MATADLRPMTIGEVLDRTFKLYKTEFWLFTGIMSLPFLVIFVFNISIGAVSNGAVTSMRAGHMPSFSPGLIAGGVGAIVLFVIGILVLISVGQAATIFAVSDIYLGRTATIRGSFQQVRGHVLQVIGTIILVGVAILAVFFVAVPVILAARSLGTVVLALSIFGLFLFLIFAAIGLVCRLSLAVPVVTLENNGPFSALSRSLELTKGFAMQIFVILLLYWVLSSVASMVFTLPFLFLSMFPRPHVLPFGLVVLQDACSFVAQVLVAPIQTIAISLMYYNLRVRKEGFDLEHLIGSLGTSSTPDLPAPGAALTS
jgi:hypothetical protein